jgi:hypothetical protein
MIEPRLVFGAILGNVCRDVWRQKALFFDSEGGPARVFPRPLRNNVAQIFDEFRDKRCQRFNDLGPAFDAFADFLALHDRIPKGIGAACHDKAV